MMNDNLHSLIVKVSRSHRSLIVKSPSLTLLLSDLDDVNGLATVELSDT